MGVLSLQLLVCCQLILFSLAVENATYTLSESPSNMTNTSQINTPATTAASQNTTGNYTENNESTSVSNSTHNPSNTNLTTSTSQMTPTRPQSTTSAPKPSNATVSGSTVKPNSTTAHMNQTRTSAPVTTQHTNTTVSTSSTTVTSRYNTTYSSTTVSTTTKTSPATKPTEKTSTTVTQDNSTDFIKSAVGLNHSEKSLTVLFSALLGVIVVTILVYFAHKFSKRKQTRVQYTHRRLQSEDTGEQFAAPEDTLVISGGLYDGPQIYNPTMTVQNEEDLPTDASGFGYTPAQFRLEFLKEDQQRAPDRETSTFQTFHTNDQES